MFQWCHVMKGHSRPSGHKESLKSGKQKEPKPKLFGPDIFRWGVSLPREGVGAKRFGMSFETQENNFLGRISRDFWPDMPGVPEKFEKKVSVQFSDPMEVVMHLRIASSTAWS